MNRTQIAFALIFVVNNISLIESSVILLTYIFFSLQECTQDIMRGWLANVLRAEIVSIGFSRNQQTRYVHVCACVCEHTNVPGRVKRRDGLWQIGVCQLANLDFTINVMVHHTKAFSKHQLCYTHSYIYFCVYVHTGCLQLSWPVIFNASLKQWNGQSLS